MALPGPGNGPSEATAIMAYELRCQHKSYRQIATLMAGDPHRCGGHTTAMRWVAIGQAILTRDEDGRFDPMRKRRARREMAIDQLDDLAAEMRVDAKAAGEKLDLKVYYDYRIRVILAQAQLGGWRGAPEPSRVKVTGGGGGRVPRELIESLGAVPLHERLVALGWTPPDESELPD